MHLAYTKTGLLYDLLISYRLDIICGVGNI